MLFIKQDLMALDGKISRDITGEKQRYMLTFENIHKDIVETILGKIERDEYTTFTVNDGLFQVSETNVWGSVKSLDMKKGGLYFRNFELELLEVE